MRRLIPLFLLLLSCGEGAYDYSIEDVKASSIVLVSSLGNILDEVSGGGTLTATFGEISECEQEAPIPQNGIITIKERALIDAIRHSSAVDVFVIEDEEELSIEQAIVKLNNFKNS